MAYHVPRLSSEHANQAAQRLVEEYGRQLRSVRRHDPTACPVGFTAFAERAVWTALQGEMGEEALSLWRLRVQLVTIARRKHGIIERAETLIRHRPQARGVSDEFDWAASRRRTCRGG